MHVVATAGHVDHGKSTLVRALTGTDPDRLEEERRRGLSIELGYAWADLPGVGEVAFVDVPGHERFIATTLSGVGPVPVALLVVAADDPWMPQAAEHLAALDALGVRHGVLVVTRADLCDPAPAMERARTEVRRTSLRDIPAVAVSGRTGAGMDQLRSTLAAELAGVPAPDPAADVRLWVDRCFSVKGTGTVVTGTLPAGTVSVGDTLLALGEDDRDAEPVRVRAVESLGRSRDRMSGVARVALDLGGRAPQWLGRGSVLVTPGAYAPTRVVDVRIDETERLPERPVLHVGSVRLGTHAHLLAPGLARVRLERPLPLRVGDAMILRDPGSRRLWGVRVLDPAPPPPSRRGVGRARVADLASHDGSAAAELRIRGIVRASLLRRIGAPVEPLPAGTITAGDWLVAPGVAGGLRSRLAALVAARADGVAGGVPLPEAARELDLPDPALVGALVAGAGDPALRVEGGRVTDASAPRLPPGLERAAAALLAGVDGFNAPEAGRIGEVGLDERGLAALHRAGRVLRVDDKVVLQPGADDRALAVLRGLPQPFTTSQARQALGTSRRVALPLLAHLDSTGRTVRLADDTRRVRRPT